MRKPVSVVIPCYNGRELLVKHLPPLVKELDRAADEIIVVDDGSTDGIGEFIRTDYPFIRLIELAQNSGYLNASNVGFKAAKHDLVLLMNTDVLVAEGFLEPLVKNFDSDDMFAACSLELPLGNVPRVFAISAVDFRYGIFWYRYLPLPQPLTAATPTLFVHGALTLYDRRKLLALGCHDTLYRPLYWEDMDLCYRAWKRGWVSCYEPASAHWHKSQTTIGKMYTRNTIKANHWKNRFLFTWKNIRSPWLICRHLFWLPFELVLMPLVGKGEFLIGFLRAFRQLPEALRKRRAEKKEIFSDEDILRRFSPRALQQHYTGSGKR